MSTTAYQPTHHISKSFPRRNFRTSSTLNVKPSRGSNTPLIAKHYPNVIHSTLESLSTDSDITEQTLTSNTLTISNDNTHTTPHVQKQVYTFSNPPREIDPTRKSLQKNRLRRRISSAPIEKSSYLISNNKKPSSAVGSLSTRSHNISDDDNTSSCELKRAVQLENPVLRSEDQQKNSFNALMKEQKKSTVPKSVQRRRYTLFFHHLTQKEKQTTPSLPSNNQIETSDGSINPTNKQSESSPVNSVQSSLSTNDMSPDMADSFDLAAILHAIQTGDDSTPSKTSPEQESQTYNLIKYEFVASPMRTQTLQSSPDVIKPDEEIFGGLTFRKYYRHEMESSVNAQIPNFSASIISDSNSTIGNDADLEQTFTLKLSPKNTIKRPSYFDNDQQLESTIDNEKIQLFYDATLKRFYDPNTGEYYELVSA